MRTHKGSRQRERGEVAVGKLGVSTHRIDLDRHRVLKDVRKVLRSDEEGDHRSDAGEEGDELVAELRQ